MSSRRPSADTFPAVREKTHRGSSRERARESERRDENDFTLTLSLVSPDHQRGGRGHSHGHHRHERGRGRGGGDRGHGRGRGRGRGAAGEVRTGRGGSWLDPSVTVPKPARTSLAYKLIQDSALTDTDVCRGAICRNARQRIK